MKAAATQFAGDVNTNERMKNHERGASLAVFLVNKSSRCQFHQRVSLPFDNENGL